jgi:hypothetical protein
MVRLHQEAIVINLYAGFDPREEIGYHTFVSSVIHHSSVPVAVCPLDLGMLEQVYDGGERDGTNAFIYSRFLIPYLQGYRGMAIFADGADMICKADIAELAGLYSPFKAVQVVKHDYETKFPRKYVGTQMEAHNADYPRKNWSSLMLINCGHFSWRDITPESVANLSGSMLHRFDFIPERFIGELPIEWNWLADEYGENADAKLLHWTVGIPAFPHYAHAPHADDWAQAAVKITHATS